MRGFEHKTHVSSASPERGQHPARGLTLGQAGQRGVLRQEEEGRENGRVLCNPLQKQRLVPTGG